VLIEPKLARAIFRGPSVVANPVVIPIFGLLPIRGDSSRTRARDQIVEADFNIDHVNGELDEHYAEVVGG
jgi:hypothetical protein